MQIAETVFSLLILSMAVASIAWTVTQEDIFSELHDVCLRRSKIGKTIIERKFFYVFTCEYCFSHWVTLVIMIVSGFRLLYDDWRGFLAPNEARFVRDGKADISVDLSSTSAETIQKIKAAGLEILSDKGRTVSGRIAVENLAALAAIKEVMLISPKI